jgi:hypothetical protein
VAYSCIVATSDGLSEASGSFIGNSAVDPEVQRAVQDAVFLDGCHFIARFGIWTSDSAPPFSSDACKSFDGGLVSRGLHGGISQLMQLVSEACETRGLADVINEVTGIGSFVNSTVPYSIPAALVAAPARLMLNLTDNYLIPAFNGITKLYQLQDAIVLANQQAFLVALVASFLSIFLVYMGVFYLPAVVTVNAEIKSQRAMVGEINFTRA